MIILALPDLSADDQLLAQARAGDTLSGLAAAAGAAVSELMRVSGGAAPG